MTYVTGSFAKPVITDPSTQPLVEFLGGLVRTRLGATDTDGGFAILEHTGGRGYGSPVHLHDNDEETFLVLDGTLRVEVGGDVRSVGSGGLALLPRGLAHGFVVTSSEARFLTVHTPSGFDRFVTEVGVAPEYAADTAPLSPEELTRVAAGHGIQIVGPPLMP
ncbi:cupin domain-containing protein [Paractinoplanes atraurantiacus]|uniref:Cupin domain protein n=1 Tax=Paractinoplanes atraurantiacus TaxID=1036182 RepID=A0A285II53_9ACTN|nr:cupin domain-containing protein [Actinoplanes atraurantiacus]SNY47665.1 Cupin domain protein [Actinoplanes atraurantiacus]